MLTETSKKYPTKTALHACQNLSPFDNFFGQEKHHGKEKEKTGPEEKDR